MNFAKDQIARQFSRAAETYDHSALLQHTMANRLIDRLFEEPANQGFKERRQLVDLGCGTGWALGKIANHTEFDLTAVDIAPGMIEVAMQRVPEATFHCCDLEETNLTADFADVVFSNAAIQWCHLESALAEIKRICKPGGRVLLSTFGPGTCQEIKSAWQQVDEKNQRVHEFCSPNLLEAEMMEIGFENVQVESELHELLFDSVHELLQSLKQIGATNASSTRQRGLLGTKKYRAFQEVLEEQLRSDGQLKLTFHSVFASAAG